MISPHTRRHWKYHQPHPHWQFPLARPEKPLMQAHILERILFVVIACTVIFAGLCLYTYLVSIYQSHWVSIPFLSLSVSQIAFNNSHGIGIV
jgi:hypothetical protein